MVYIRMKDLQINDVFIDPMDGEVYQVEGFVKKEIVNPDAPETIELKLQTMKGSASYPSRYNSTYNANFQCEYLRPGSRNIDLVILNMGA